MAGEYSSGKEEDWEMACVCGLHRLEQSVSKGPLPHVSD